MEGEGRGEGRGGGKGPTAVAGSERPHTLRRPLCSPWRARDASCCLRCTMDSRGMCFPLCASPSPPRNALSLLPLCFLPFPGLGAKAPLLRLAAPGHPMAVAPPLGTSHETSGPVLFLALVLVSRARTKNRRSKIDLRPIVRFRAVDLRFQHENENEREKEDRPFEFPSSGGSGTSTRGTSVEEVKGQT